MCSICSHIACVCEVLRHDDACKLRKSATCAVPIECEHGYDVCPICDPCTCAPRIVDHKDNPLSQVLKEALEAHNT